MGVYLYGELMVQEDARQQALARRCLSFTKDDMDQSARSVVEEMILWIRTNQVRVSRPLCPLLYTVKKNIFKICYHNIFSFVKST